jgi:hypothetical protein
MPVKTAAFRGSRSRRDTRRGHLQSEDMANRWQLLERPAEFDSVRSTLTGGTGGGVVLTGAAGVGKSTLARAVTATLRSDVNWVGCTESSRSIPLGVFAHRVPTTGSRDPVALLAATRESILAGPDTVIGVDDAHLLDHLSSTSSAEPCPPHGTRRRHTPCSPPRRRGRAVAARRAARGRRTPRVGRCRTPGCPAARPWCLPAC